MTDAEKERGLKELQRRMRKSAIVWAFGIAIGIIGVITIGIQTNMFVALGVIAVVLGMGLVEASREINPNK